MNDPANEIAGDLVSAREFLVEAAKKLDRWEGEGLKLHRTRMAIVELDENITELAFPDERDSLELVS